LENHGAHHLETYDKEQSRRLSRHIQLTYFLLLVFLFFGRDITVEQQRELLLSVGIKSAFACLFYLFLPCALGCQIDCNASVRTSCFPISQGIHWRLD